MIKPKQPLNKGRNSIVRKPSLPIKRTSSAQSNISEHSSCMSDRIAYKKNQQQTLNRALQANQLKKSMNNTFQHEKAGQFLGSNKSLKKLKNKINGSTNEIVKKSQHFLTGFQWLIILRHCFHSENKRRPTQSIKQRSLVNYIRTKVYPDSLWNKILVLDNETKFSTTQIIACIEKQSKEKLTLDDIFICISKNFIHGKLQGHQQSQSAAQTARFIENMKPNIQIKQLSSQYNSKPRFIQKNVQSVKNQIQKNKSTKVLKKQAPNKHIQPISTVNLNSFQIQPQLGLNISPISVIDQTNDISFSISDSQLHTQSFSRIQSQLQSHSQSISEQMENRFQSGFNGIQAFKKNLQSSSKTSEQKQLVTNYLEQILNYSIYKKKQKKNLSGFNNKKSTLLGAQTSDKSQLILTSTQYFHGLKLQTRKNMSKIKISVLQKLFKSQSFGQYFNNFQAIKISQYNDQLPLTMSILSQRLRILNLSYNTIRSISFLKDLHLQNLQFINLSNNEITNISQLLSLQNLIQIHVKNNMIDHVSSDKVTAKMVKIIDLANNRIQKQEDLWALAKLTSLTMLNLAGNSILVGFKSIELIRKQVIVDHSQMYVFSAYTQYKDIAFEAKQKQKENKGQQI